MRLLRFLLPTSRAALALWAWRNRDHIKGWGELGVRAVREGASSDVLTEGRLRVSLARDRRTREATDLRVRVDDGVAVLRGRATPEAHRAAFSIAESTRGVERVRDEVDVIRARRGLFARA